MSKTYIFEMVARIRECDSQICAASGEDEISGLVRARESLFAELMSATPQTGPEARVVLRQIAADMKFFEIASDLLRPLMEVLGNAPPFPAWDLSGESGA